MENQSRILQRGHSSVMLSDYLEGKIKHGLGLGCELDNHLLWKPKQLNIILGHDNVGKTYFQEWYLLALAIIHGKTSTIFMDENDAWKIMRDMIQMRANKPFKELEHNELRKHESFIENHVKFVDNKYRYNHKQLIEVFHESNTDNYLIDPYNAIDMPFTYAGNYEVLNDLKMFCKKESKTIYINTHPASASGRRMSVFPKGHDWEGHVMPPLKSDAEGGKPFANKADDFIIIHRLTQHETMWNLTMVEVSKIKDTDTGGKPTKLDMPVMLDYNFGKGFKCGGVDVLRQGADPQPEIKPKANINAINQVSAEFEKPRQPIKETDTTGIMAKLNAKGDDTPF